MASNGYQYKCRQTRAHTPNHMHTHTNTWSQLTGAKDIAVGSQVLARYHVQIHTHTHTQKYKFLTVKECQKNQSLQTCNMHARDSELNLRDETKDAFSLYDFLPLR